MKAFSALLLLFLISFSSASLIWQFSTDGPLSIKPVVYQGNIVVASEDGNIYSLDPVAGSKRWQAAVGKSPNEIFIFDNAIVASIGSGKVVKVGGSGTVLWTVDFNTTKYNVSHVFGASANQNIIYVTTDNGVYIIERDGTVRPKLVSYNESIVTPPFAGPDYVIFGREKELVRVSETGTTQWKAKVALGSFWLSRPVLEGTVVYIGALDNGLHAYLLNGGAELWNARTKNWVVSTPSVRGGNIYFGSNDGKVYAVDSSTGNPIWSAQTQLAVQSKPEAGTMGGKEVVFAGGTDKSIYAISTDTGEIVWKGTSAGAVGSPLFYQNSIIFGAGDGKVYSYSTERACSITTPHEADIVGLKELAVSGKFVSEAGGARVSVQVNDGEWQEANTSDVDWVFYLNPKASLNSGLNTISCKVTDASGDESGPSFTTVAINHDPTIPLSNIVVTVPPNIVEGKQFSVFINDGDDGSPLERFNLTFEGRGSSGSKNLTLTAPSAGNYQLKVTKIGFNDALINVNVNSSGLNPFYVVVGVLLIVIIIWQLWSKVLSKRVSPKKK